MTETQTAPSLDGLAGKTVLFTIRNEDGTTSQVEGVVEAASAIGVAFKKKGQSQLVMHEADAIETFEVLPEKPKVLKQKNLKPIPTDQVRAHLADRHGINLTWLNSVSNEEAEAYHNSIDHVTGESGPLGHKHEATAEKAEDAELKEALAD